MSRVELPPQVAEYYRRSVPKPPEVPRNTIVEQSGEIRLGPDRPWMPFTAEQSISADHTEFLWHARFRMAPLVTGVVEDAYKDGRGRLDAKVWGVIPVAHSRGLEVDRGEAQRYLAELVWCPMALAHNRELNFRVLSESIVRVWIHDEQTYVDWVFDDAGDIVAAKTDARARGDEVQPWQGRFGGFKNFDGIRAPSSGAVSWLAPDGPFEYWRGQITSLQFSDEDGELNHRSRTSNE